MKTLDEIARSVSPGGDKDSAHHGYTPHYDEVFSPFRDKPIRLLEIGVEFGLSLNIWLEYFQNVHVTGVDINDNNVRNSRFTFVKGDQRSPDFWKLFFVEIGGDFDIVIDDGCHKSSGIITSFEAIWPHVKSGGLYCIEDLMCSYYASCDEPGWISSMQFVKGILDDINAQTDYVNTPEGRVFRSDVNPSRKIAWLRQSEELVILKKK